MNHKDHKRINIWLRDLREKGCVEWIYSTHFAAKTKPAIYYVGGQGVRYLRHLMKVDQEGEMQVDPSETLRKLYRESTRSQAYIDRCILLADCCISLKQQSTDQIDYFYQTESDYLLESSYYHFILESELIHPSLVFSEDRLDKEGKEEETLYSYILEVFDSTLPRYRIKKRLDNYVKYLDNEDFIWKQETDTDKLPFLLFVCQRTSDLIYAKRHMRKLVAEAWGWKDKNEKRPRVGFTTVDKLKQFSILAKDTWEWV